MRILILHASAGFGHARAAEALRAAFASVDLEAIVTVSDILDFTSPVFRDTYAKGYLRVVRAAPELWGYMYAVSDRKSSIPWRRKVRTTFNAINTVSFRGFVKKTDPDVVVCTHFMPLELLASRGRRGKFTAPLYCVVTDFAVHSLWIVSNVSGYYVATENARRHLIRRGQPPDRVEVTGIPIAPEFSAAVPPPAGRERLGLEPGRPAALIMSGGFGVGPAVDLLRSFRGRSPHLQLLVVAGANEHLRRDCETEAAELDIPVRVFGFVNNVHELIDAADVVVSKSGGLTASEVMAKGRPLVIVNPIPGQEQRNCEYLLEAGAATRVYEMDGAADRIIALIDDADRLARMSACARGVGRPHAAETIARDILARQEW
jgi:processive 1,2-diacylglycerol beta-glucosyltransferase